MVDCYVALGGNFADTFCTMQKVVERLEATQGIEGLTLSKLYQTSPVSAIPQADYLNAVCRFRTALSVEQLWEMLKQLQTEVGQGVKEKDAPRLIDLDLLFYGDVKLRSEELNLPHPRWQSRLFVLVPLADITREVPSGHDVHLLLKQFNNPHGERVQVSQRQLDA